MAKQHITSSGGVRLNSAITNRLTELHMSQRELAHRIGVSPQHVSQILKDKSTASMELLVAIERVLRMPEGLISGNKGASRRQIASLTKMPGVEVEYLNVAMFALRDARSQLLSMTPTDAIRPARGKLDTLFFDAACEGVITRTLEDFNNHAAIFTEEKEEVERGLEFARQTCFFIDPFDRSVPFKELLNKGVQEQIPTVADLFAHPSNTLVGIMAPSGSISCVRDGQISFNVIMDYCSGEVYVACSAMLKHGSIDKCPDSEMLACHGDDIRFEPRRGLQFTCFLGVKGTEKRAQYEKHLEALKFPSERRPPRDLEDPGGPARILFLSDACTTDHKLAFILSNGEKISEWFGWLAYVFHSDDLAAFEIFADKVSTVRDKILLAPPPNYSMFQIGKDKICRLNLERILILGTPVLYRSALAIAHKLSNQSISEMTALDSRQLIMRDPAS